MNTKVKLAKIVNNSKVDGPGVRTAVFFQGCSIRCEGCQNRHLWDHSAGEAVEVKELAQTLVEPGLPITISGGEPFDQPHVLALLLCEIRALDEDRHIIVYTGNQFRDLALSNDPDTLIALAMADVLVDGPFRPELDDDRVQYRGSRNQRPIDLNATIAKVEDLPAYPFASPVVLNWDEPEFIITRKGDLVGAAGFVRDFARDLGRPSANRMCGQTT